MFKIDQSNQILHIILDVQQRLGRMKTELDGLEDALWKDGWQEEDAICGAREEVQRVAQQLDELREMASEVNAKVLPIVQRRILDELALLEVSKKTLQGRVESLSEISPVRLEVRALMDQIYQCEADKLPDLNMRIIRLMEQKPQIPIQMLSELCRSQLRIDQILAEEEQRRLPEAFNTFFEIFEAAKQDGKNGKNVIQKAVGSLPKEVRNKIYRRIYEVDGSPKTKDGLYGENHVVDNLSRLRGIVMEVQEEMAEKARAEQDFSLFSHERSAPLQLPPTPDAIFPSFRFLTTRDLSSDVGLSHQPPRLSDQSVHGLDSQPSLFPLPHSATQLRTSGRFGSSVEQTPAIPSIPGFEQQGHQQLQR